MTDIVLNGFLRVWTIENGAGPANRPVYQGCFKPGDVSQNFGDVTRVECPDPNAYNRFVEVAEVQAAQERVTTSLMGRYPKALSDLLRLARKQCRVDVHVHIGECRDPRDFNGGWEKKLIFPKGRLTSYGTENFGALGSDERAEVNETADLSAEEVYEVERTEFTELAQALVVREITALAVCDALSCGGDCGDASDGCQKVFAGQKGTATTPGTVPAVLFSADGGATFDTSLVDSLFANEIIDGLACVAENLVIVSNTPCSLHYAPIQDVLDGVESWLEVTTGFVVTGCPNAIASAGPSATWIVGDGGYIYLMAHPATGVTVQDAGVATTQDLAAVHAFDHNNVLAVGAANAVVYTNNGSIWQAVTGPAVGVALTACWMLSPKVWLVGDANGALWYTTDAGAHWTQIALPIAATSIADIAFVNDTVGFLAVGLAGPAGRILKTTNGGNSWYVLPENKGSIPANDAINALAVCADPNIVFGGGLGDNGSGGIIVKAA